MSSDSAVRNAAEKHLLTLEVLTRSDKVTVSEMFNDKDMCFCIEMENGNKAFMDVKDHIDTEAVQEKLTKTVTKHTNDILKLQKQLTNKTESRESESSDEDSSEDENSKIQVLESQLSKINSVLQYIKQLDVSKDKFKL